MNKTSIPSCDYTWNPVAGCLRGCSYCYARKIAHRFKGGKAFPDGFNPTFHEGRLWQPDSVQKPSKIFVCSMGELFGPWVDWDWQMKIINVAQITDWHTFQFLTKYPENLARWNPWPDNAWVGATATDQEMTDHTLAHLAKVDAKVRFISFEPLLGPVRGDFDSLQWAIIGGQTNPNQPPKKEWAIKLIEDLDKAGVPTFVKHNAGNWTGHWEPRWPKPSHRQETETTLEGGK